MVSKILLIMSLITSDIDNEKQFVNLSIEEEDNLESVNNFQVIWRNLCYYAADHQRHYDDVSQKTTKTRAILKYLNGMFKSGELTAIMGPSGSGKTTLLECLSGIRKRGVSGDILCTGKENIKLSYIGQNDHILGHLTVRESLTFASKLKNATTDCDTIENCKAKLSVDMLSGKRRKYQKLSESKLRRIPHQQVDHNRIVKNLLEQLGLEKCADVRVKHCSGGQIRRLSIAQELTSKPNILILDEPTSGLDSASCNQCVELLLKLTRQDPDNPMAIVSTIHQPSSRIFSMFHRLYFLSVNGQCIFEGGPNALIGHLSDIGLKCPPYSNPSDFMTEVANGDLGMECVFKLEDLIRNQSTDLQAEKAIIAREAVDINKKLDKRNKFPKLRHTWLLFNRTMLSIARDPVLTSLRFVAHILIAMFIGLLYGGRIGKASGCPPAYDDFISFLSVQKDIYKDVMSSNENVANIFFANLFIMFGAMMPTVLTFPEELSVFMKERANGWYSCGIYYIAKTLADIPFQVIFPAIYGAIIYYMNAQVYSLWRFTHFIIMLVLVALTSQSHGMLVSAFFMEDATAAVFFAPIASIPTLLFAGFFVRMRNMPHYFIPLTYISYIRYGFEAMLAVTYGFGRCMLRPNTIVSEASNGTITGSIVKMITTFLPNSNQIGDTILKHSNTTALSHNPALIMLEGLFKQINSNNPLMKDIVASKNNSTSFIMSSFGLNDDTFYTNVFRLFLCFVILRIAAYLTLRWKMNKKK